MTGAAAPLEDGWVLRAYRLALDPTLAQEQQLAQHAGAARWAFNHALAAKVAAHQLWRDEVAALVETGVDEQAARRQVKVPVPTKPVIQRAWNAGKGDETTGVDGVCPWWRSVSTYAFQSAFADADTAWSNWLSSLAGRRKGRRVGYPRFKKKHRSRDSFRLHHDVKNPSIRFATYRRLRVPRIGEIRVHGTAKPIARRVTRGQAVIQSVTISRTGHRWYASVLAKVHQPAPTSPTRTQAAAGTVGVDAGVKHLATLSTGEVVPNPRHTARSARRLAKAQRALSRTQKGSARRARARARVARVQAETAERRRTGMHQLTKRLATGWATIGLEDLNVAGMTRSARGTVEVPGTNVAAKSGLNRAIVDAAFAELRRQLEYKTTWYGSRLVVIDRWAPTSKTCSACGRRKSSLTLAERTYRCGWCGLVMDRDHNAAVNIAALATAPAPAPAPSPGLAPGVAPGSGETETGRGADVSLDHRLVVEQPAAKRQDPRRPGRRGPPRRSNAAALPFSTLAGRPAPALLT